MEELTMFGVAPTPYQLERARFRARLRRTIDDVLACHTSVGEPLAADLVRALETSLASPTRSPQPRN